MKPTASFYADQRAGSPYRSPFVAAQVGVTTAVMVLIAVCASMNLEDSPFGHPACAHETHGAWLSPEAASNRKLRTQFRY
jgi:hypothetical protein